MRLPGPPLASASAQSRPVPLSSPEELVTKLEEVEEATAAATGRSPVAQARRKSPAMNLRPPRCARLLRGVTKSTKGPLGRQVFIWHGTTKSQGHQSPERATGVEPA